MMTHSLPVAILLGAAAGLSVWMLIISASLKYITRRRQRMSILLGGNDFSEEPPQQRSYIDVDMLLAEELRRRSFAQRLLKPLWQRLTRLTLRYAPTRIISTLQRQLDSAGNPGRVAPHELLIAKLVSMGFGLLIGLGTLAPLLNSNDVLRSTLYIIAAAVAGFMLPDYWVYRQRRKHLLGISQALPDVVDLLRVSIEGGLSFDGAVNYVTVKVKNPLTYELHRYLVDRQIGRTQEEALHSMAVRTREPDLQNLVEVVIQGETLGTGVNRALGAFSTDMRTRRRQRAEKKAHEASMKMLFPMVLLIFPSVFIIILGPAVPIFMKSFGI